MFGNHGLCGLLEEGAHEKSPKCLGGNLGDFGEFCKGLRLYFTDKKAGHIKRTQIKRNTTPYFRPPSITAINGNGAYS